MGCRCFYSIGIQSHKNMRFSNFCLGFLAPVIWADPVTLDHTFYGPKNRWAIDNIFSHREYLNVEGAVGTWQDDWTQCDFGYYACGFKVRIEDNSETQDATGVNSIQMKCCSVQIAQIYYDSIVNDANLNYQMSNGQGHINGDWNREMYYERVHEGIWGKWYEAECELGHYVNDIDVRYQEWRQQMRGGPKTDNTQMNGIRFGCLPFKCVDRNCFSHFKINPKSFNHGQRLIPVAPDAVVNRMHGDWQFRTVCPASWYVCGLKTRVFPKQGTTRDDVAVSGMATRCCRPSNIPDMYPISKDYLQQSEVFYYVPSQKGVPNRIG